jgi:hypothetical protein
VTSGKSRGGHVQVGQTYRSLPTGRGGAGTRLRVSRINGDKATVDYLDTAGNPYSVGIVPLADLNLRAVTPRGKARRRGFVLDTEEALRLLAIVECRTVQGAPDGTHLSVAAWNSRVGEWLTEQALCGQSAEQGILPASTPVTCEACEGRRNHYERALAGRSTAEQEELAVLRRQVDRVRQWAETTAHGTEAAFEVLTILTEAAKEQR